MKTRISFVLLALCVALGLALVAGTAQAAIILADTFTYDDSVEGYYIDGYMPEVSLSGNPWRSLHGAPWDQAAFPPSAPYHNPPFLDEGYWAKYKYGGVSVKNGNALSNIGGASGYSLIHFSADLRPENLGQDLREDEGWVEQNYYAQGIGIGVFGNGYDDPILFGATKNYPGYGDQPYNFSKAWFTGVMLTRTGSVYTIHNPSEAQPEWLWNNVWQRSLLVAWAGSVFNTNAYTNLSYDMDPLTGEISNIVLAGSTADYSTIEGTEFWTSATADYWTHYAGFYGSGDTGFPRGNLDNFSLTGDVIPEPTTLIVWSLLGTLAITIGWWRRRKAA